MEFENHELKVFLDLGLTMNQARTYLALARNGPLKVIDISKLNKVARPDLYQVLLKLQKHGLVEKIIKTPIEYKAIPLNKGLSFLLEEKTKKYKEIRAETEMLRHKIEKEKSNIANKKDTFQFVSIFSGRSVIERLGEAIDNAKTSIDSVLSWKRFSRGIIDTFSENIENAWTRKVKTRFILKHPQMNKTMRDMIQYCNKKPYCEIIVINDFPHTIFGIYDKKEMFLVENPKTDLPSSPILWSNNPSLIALTQNHFEHLWLKAVEEI